MAPRQPTFTYVKNLDRAVQLVQETGATLFYPAERSPSVPHAGMEALRTLKDVVAPMQTATVTGFTIPRAYRLLIEDDCPADGPMRIQAEARVKRDMRIRYAPVSVALEPSILQQGRGRGMRHRGAEAVAHHFLVRLAEELDVRKAEPDLDGLLIRGIEETEADGHPIRTLARREVEVLSANEAFRAELAGSIAILNIPTFVVDVEHPDGGAMMAIVRNVEDEVQLVAASHVGRGVGYNLTDSEVRELRENPDFMESLSKAARAEEPAGPEF